MPLRPLLLAVSAFLAAVHVFGVLAGAPALPWAGAAAFSLLFVYAAGARDRNYPLLAALGALTVHALVTMPRKVPLGGQYMWAELKVTFEKPDVIDDFARRGYREAAFMLLVVTLLLFAALAGTASTRAVLIGGGVAMTLVAGYAAMRIANIMIRIGVEAARDGTDQSPWVTGGALSVLASVPVAAGLVAVFIAVVAARRPWVVAGAVLLTLGAVLRTDEALRSILLPYEVVMNNPFAAWDGLTSSATLPGLTASLRAGLEITGIILVVAGLSHRAAGGRVGEG